MKPFLYGSLFSGIGGIDLGLDRAGMTCAFQVEQNPFCLQVLAKHWPNVPKFTDIREVKSEELPAIDLLAGGFPCQDVSLAGRRAGIDGERSGLWSEFFRLVREIRPRFALVENTPGLLSGGMDEVLGDLASIGYDTDWQSLPAAAFASPQLRCRIFIVAYPGSERGEARNQAPIQAGRLQPQLRDRRSTSPRVCRGADGIPDRMDRIAALGNAVHPKCAEFFGRRIMEAAR